MRRGVLCACHPSFHQTSPANLPRRYSLLLNTAPRQDRRLLRGAPCSPGSPFPRTPSREQIGSPFPCSPRREPFQAPFGSQHQSSDTSPGLQNRSLKRSVSWQSSPTQQYRGASSPQGQRLQRAGSQQLNLVSPQQLPQAVRIDHFSEGTIAKRRQASLSQHTPTVTPRGPKRDSFEEQREKSVQGQAHTKRDSPQQLPQAVRIDPFSEGTIVKRRQASLSQHTPTVTPRGPKRDSFEEQREKSVQGQAHSKRDSSAQPECSRCVTHTHTHTHSVDQ